MGVPWLNMDNSEADFGGSSVVTIHANNDPIIPVNRLNYARIAMIAQAHE